MMLELAATGLIAVSPMSFDALYDKNLYLFLEATLCSRRQQDTFDSARDVPFPTFLYRYGF